MNGIIFELEEKSKYTGRYMDGEISYNNTSIDYTKEIRECDRKSEIKDLLNDPCLGKIFEKGEVDDEIIYNGNIEDVKEEWMRAIQNGVDKMNVNKDMNGHNLIYVIKYSHFSLRDPRMKKKTDWFGWISFNYMQILFRYTLLVSGLVYSKRSENI